MVDADDRWLGMHRVLEPPGVLPQAAWRLDSVSACQAEELEIAVSALHVDAASFRQIAEAEAGDPVAIGRHVQALVARRGKLHNPTTGSGGMLIGRVIRSGARFPGAPAQGEAVASLTSLTLTPLRLDAIKTVTLDVGRISVEGRAFLFGDCPWSLLPTDLSEAVALAALDVAGAAPRTRLRTKPGDRVLILGGGGRSGLLASVAAREAGAASVVAVDIGEEGLARARTLGAATEVVRADVLRPMDVASRIGAAADLTVSCVDVPGGEAAAILATKPDGWVLFFSMATSFQAASLTAEGLGRPTSLEIGNGYIRGHAEETLSIVRRHPQLQRWLGEE